MHRIYTSEAVVLGSRIQGEANRVITLFTREYGLVHAVATSVRREASKLRYGLTTHSRVMVSLVRGREVWRVTNVVPIDAWTYTPAYRQSVARISKLLERLMPPETAETKLFDTVIQCFDAAAREGVALPMLEIATVLHILHALGYGGEHEHFNLFLKEPLSLQSVEILVPYKKEAVAHINTALHHSHL